MPVPVRKAIFPVGGLGTRFLPATKSMPKEMLTVVDKPLIQYAVDEARDAGIEELIFITGRSEEHTSELQSLMRSSYAVFCLKKKRNKRQNTTTQKHIQYPYKKNQIATRIQQQQTTI